jgi:hypothetical protein
MPRPKKTLACGHDASEMRIIRYRCTLAQFPGGCRDVHTTAACGVCLDEGKGRPADFWREIDRKKVR